MADLKRADRTGLWKMFRLVMWLFLTGGLLWVGGLSNDLSEEWRKHRQEKAQLDLRHQQRGYVGIGPGRSESGPEKFVREVDGKVLLWSKQGQSSRGWFDVTLCRYPVAEFSYRMPLFRGVDVPILVGVGHRMLDRIPDQEPVIGVELGQSQCAYPEMVLRRVVVVNDVLDGVPIVVLFVPSPWDQMVAVYRREGIESVPVFDLTGYVYENKPVLVERDTEHLWYPDDRSKSLIRISGSSESKSFILVSHGERTTWGEWTRTHSETRLLVGADRGSLPSLRRPKFSEN